MEKKKVAINYPEGYELKYANGCFGGISPKGEMMINFFKEYSTMPTESEVTIGEDGNGQEKMIETEVVLNRDVQAGIIMDIEIAKSIYDWLGRNIKVYEEQLNGEKNGTNN